MIWPILVAMAVAVIVAVVHTHRERVRKARIASDILKNPAAALLYRPDTSSLDAADLSWMPDASDFD